LKHRKEPKPNNAGGGGFYSCVNGFGGGLKRGAHPTGKASAVTEERRPHRRGRKVKANFNVKKGGEVLP